MDNLASLRLFMLIRKLHVLPPHRLSINVPDPRCRLALAPRGVSDSDSREQLRQVAPSLAHC